MSKRINKYSLGDLRDGYKVTRQNHRVTCQAPSSFCTDCYLCEHGMQFEKVRIDGTTDSEHSLHVLTEKERRVAFKRSLQPLVLDSILLVILSVSNCEVVWKHFDPWFRYVVTSAFCICFVLWIFLGANTVKYIKDY